jgi:hypothetical protein
MQSSWKNWAKKDMEACFYDSTLFGLPKLALEEVVPWEALILFYMKYLRDDVPEGGWYLKFGMIKLEVDLLSCVIIVFFTWEDSIEPAISKSCWKHVKMYVVPQYFLLSAMRSVIVFQQQLIMVSASAIGIGTTLSHVGGAWRIDLSIS